MYLNERLQLVVRGRADGLVEGLRQSIHLQLQAFDQRENLHHGELLLARVVVSRCTLVLFAVVFVFARALAIISGMQKFPTVAARRERFQCGASEVKSILQFQDGIRPFR